jgi:hypothetical protein
LRVTTLARHTASRIRDPFTFFRCEFRFQGQSRLCAKSGGLPEFHNVPGRPEVFKIDQRIERCVAMIAHHRPALASIGEENAGCAPALERSTVMNDSMSTTVAIAFSALSVALMAAALFL